MICNNLVDGTFVCGVCAVCNGTWKDSYLTLRKDGLKAFLCSLLWSSLPAKATKDALMLLVWRQEKLSTLFLIERNQALGIIMFRHYF